MQRFSPPVLITTSMFSIIARGSENSAAQRLSPWRKGTRRRERRATSPESARARARAAAASAQPQSEARAQRAHKATQRRVAPSTRALYETTTSVTEAFCSRSAPIKRASAFCCILPLGVSRVACFHERQPALFFFGGRSANRPSEGSTQSCQTVGELVLQMLAAHSALHRFPPRPSVRVTSTVTVTTRRA